MYVLLSLLLGALTAAMVTLNGELAARVGSSASSGIVHLVGLVLVALILVATRSASPFRRGLSPSRLPGGAVGFLTVVFANAGFVEIGVSLTLALGLLGQTLSAVMMDHFGWLAARTVPADRRKLGSLALIAAGIAVMAFA